MIWNILTSVATFISMFAFIITAVYVRAELKGLEKDRYLTVTNELFTIWQSRDFMEDQLWLLHRLEQTTWSDFIAAHRCDVGETAFHRVGSFYDRVGTLARQGLINEQEILATMGGYAIAVWRKIGPLVHEARRVENSVLFADFERLLPACHSCYVPALGQDAQVNPFSIVQPEGPGGVTVRELKSRLDRGRPTTVLDVRQASQWEPDRLKLPGALLAPIDELESRREEVPTNQPVVVYCA